MPIINSSSTGCSEDEIEVGSDLFVDTRDDMSDGSNMRSGTPGIKKNLMSPRLGAVLSGRGPHRRERTFSASGSKSQTVLRTQQRNIYIAGRPPWYDAHGHHFVEPFTIGMSSCQLLHHDSNL